MFKIDIKVVYRAGKVVRKPSAGLGKEEETALEGRWECSAGWIAGRCGASSLGYWRGEWLGPGSLHALSLLSSQLRLRLEGDTPEVRLQ